MRNNLLLLRAAAGRATDVTGDGNEPIGAHDEVVGPEPEYEVIHKGRVAAGAACGQQARVRVREVKDSARGGGVSGTLFSFEGKDPSTGLTQGQLDIARAFEGDPPILTYVLDAETGKQLVWNGGIKKPHQS